MPRRPTPKDASPQKAKLKSMAGVRQDRTVQRRHPKWSVKWRWAAPCDGLVARSNEIREKGCLPQRPSAGDEAAILCGLADKQEDQRRKNWHKHSQPEGRAGQHKKRLGPRPPIISPIAIGRDDRHRQGNCGRVPPKIATAEYSDHISRKPIKQFRHSAIIAMPLAHHTEFLNVSRRPSEGLDAINSCGRPRNKLNQYRLVSSVKNKKMSQKHPEGQGRSKYPSATRLIPLGTY